MKCLWKKPQHIYHTLLQTSSANRQIRYSSVDCEIRNWTKKSNQIQNLNMCLWLHHDYTIWEVNEMAAFDSPAAKALSPHQTLPLLVAFSSIVANLEGVKAFCFRHVKVVYRQFWQQNSLCCEVKPFPGAINLSLWVPCGYLITTLVLSHPCRMWCLLVTGNPQWVSETLYHLSLSNSVKSCWRRKVTLPSSGTDPLWTHQNILAFLPLCLVNGENYLPWGSHFTCTA